MADAIVSPIFESLSAALVRECSRLEGVKEQVELLQLRFRFMKSFLKDAEKKRKPSVEVEEQVIQVIELAYDVEDVINAYMLYLEQQRAKRFSFKTINIYNKLVTLHRFSKDIEAINARAEAISKFALEYKTTDVETAEGSGAGATHGAWRRIGIPRTQELDVVGFQDQSVQLINLLKQESLHLRVISIIAQGGSGKTTLAQKIYNDPNVTSYFDARMWVTVSQEYKEKDVLVSALKSLSLDNGYCDRMVVEELKEELWEQLGTKKYLLVVDDIWNLDAWEKLIHKFPSDNYGSRVLLTTRNKQVALHVDPSRTNHHELQMLNTNESWELFCKKIFWMPDDSCPPELESLGREIVHKCGGIPLSILVAGGLLMGRERSHKEWSKVNADLNLYLSQDSSKCYQILMLSYYDLPSNLKSCLLYLGMFPEDFEIPALKVIRLCVSEGFVQSKGHQNMEDVAEDYLEELCQRSLIQVKRRRYNQGPLETFKVHDVLRELVISEGRKYRFMDNNDTYSGHIEKNRRLSVDLCVDDGEAKVLFTQNIRSQRSVLTFRPKFTLADSWMSRFVDGNKLLRVLDLEGVDLKKGLPKEIGNLTFLHYLGLCFTGLESLPDAIGNLINLQTLDLRHTLIEVFPKTMWKLKNLRHLLVLRMLAALGTYNGRHIPLGKEFGSNLITLAGINGMDWMNPDGVGLSNVFVKRKSLRSLYLHGNFVLNDYRMLSNCFPMSLTELFLAYTSIKEDPSAALGSLPMLKALYLQTKSYDGDELKFPSGTFPQLQYLYIGGLPELSRWTVESFALPILRQISLYDLEKLRRLPDGLRNVSTLKKIEIRRVPRVERRIQRHGEDWDIVSPYLPMDYSEYQGPSRVIFLCGRFYNSSSESE